MHLVYRALDKQPVPAVLPRGLVPPSKRRVHAASLVGATAVLPPVPMAAGELLASPCKTGMPEVRPAPGRLAGWLAGWQTDRLPVCLPSVRPTVSCSVHHRPSVRPAGPSHRPILHPYVILWIFYTVLFLCIQSVVLAYFNLQRMYRVLSIGHNSGIVRNHGIDPALV